MTSLQNLVGIELPIIQAPMAGVQGSALAVAVSNAGGLGSLPCTMLGNDAMRNELEAIRAQTAHPFSVNFFCHELQAASAEREKAWRQTLAPYFEELGLDIASVPTGDIASVPTGPALAPFGEEAADVLEAFKPPVVSFSPGARVAAS
jgi:nitronate monooxygenase